MDVLDVEYKLPRPGMIKAEMDEKSVLQVTGAQLNIDSAEFKLQSLLDASLVEHKLEEAQMNLQTMLTMRDVTPFRDVVQSKLEQLSDDTSGAPRRFTVYVAQTVHGPGGTEVKTHPFRVDQGTTGAEVIAQLASVLLLTPAHMRLVRANKNVAAEATMASCGITEGDTMVLYARGIGGSESDASMAGAGGEVSAAARALQCGCGRRRTTYAPQGTVNTRKRGGRVRRSSSARWAPSQYVSL
jgi:hypothetical protein